MDQNIEKEIFKSSLSLDYSKFGLIELFLILRVIMKDIFYLNNRIKLFFLINDLKNSRK